MSGRGGGACGDSPADQRGGDGPRPASPLVNKPVRDMRRGETMPNRPGPFSPEKQRTLQLPLLLFPMIKLLTVGRVTFIT